MKNESESIIRLNPLADVVFSCMFRNMQSAPAMKGIINAVLADANDELIEEVIDMKSQYSQIGTYPMVRGGRLDVKVKSASGELFDIEIQLNFDVLMLNRELFYGSHLMTEGLEKGSLYQEMPKTRVISFLNFILRADHPDIVQPISLMYSKPPATEATKIFRIYHVELPKFTMAYDSIEAVSGADEINNPLLQWLYMLTKGYQFDKEMEQMETRTNGMANFVSVYTHAIANPELRDKYEYIRSAEMDHNSLVRLAEDKARAEGKAEGKIEEEARGIRIYIKGLKSLGMDHSQILRQIKEGYEITTDEAERYIEQVFSEISSNAN